MIQPCNTSNNKFRKERKNNTINSTALMSTISDGKGNNASYVKMKLPPSWKDIRTDIIKLDTGNHYGSDNLRQKTYGK